MSLTINSNVSSLQTQRQLGNRTEALEKNFERLSSGKRVNRASDDPAGLAVALSILAEADTGVVAARNISDGVSALSIADGALQSSSDILTRLGELSTQAANGTLSAEQRSALNNEYQALKSELDRIASTTEFNDQALLSGSSTINLQAGTDGSENSQLGVNLPGVSASSLGLADNILTQENARFRDAFVYGAVIACLLWRPQGLFAPKSAQQRVGYQQRLRIYRPHNSINGAPRVGYLMPTMPKRARNWYPIELVNKLGPPLVPRQIFFPNSHSNF